MSLTRQLLIFQVSLLSLVLLAVTVATLQQSQASFDDNQKRRMLAVAEYTAAFPVVRYKLSQGAAPQEYAITIESLRTTSDVDLLVLTDPEGHVLASPSDPRLARTTVIVPEGAIDLGRGWTGVEQIGATSFVLARVPVLDDEGRLIGIVIAGRQYPSLGETIANAAPNLLTFLGVAGVLGVAGSFWLAARMKRQTLGLEPDEIAKLVEHREAMLHGIREGIIAIDADGIITLANDSARQLLNLPADAQGRSVDEVGLDEQAVRALRESRSDGIDALLINRGVLLALNQTVINPSRSKSEVVTTLRDRTELVALQHELGSSQQTTDTLRAQTHEFANRLHTISTLIELGDQNVAVAYIAAVSRDRTEIDQTVLSRVEDPTVAAVLIAKMSVARERGAELALSDDSRLPRVDESLSADLVTVIGNLVDNALDAVVGLEEQRVVVELTPTFDALAEVSAITVAISDSGAGVPPELMDRIFEPGVSTKSANGREGARGFGLAIVQLAVTRRGGRIVVEGADGARFSVLLPTKTVSHV